MANRRMFSKSVTSSDSFLSMSATAQNLYFHLGMEADDDGFAPFTKISKMLGTSHDDMAQLLGREFLLQFPYGVYVVRDWKVNNEIRTDRYQPTMYQKELAYLKLNKSKQYYLSDNLPMVLPNDNQLETQDRLGKDRLGNKDTYVPPKGDTSPTKGNTWKPEYGELYIKAFNRLFNAQYRVTPTRVAKLKVRFKTYTPEQISTALIALSKSKFYRGDNDRGWKADPDFLIRSDEQVDKWLNKGGGEND